MLSKLKTYALAAVGVLAAVFGFMWQLSRASHIKDKLSGEKAAREVEQKDIKATVEGLENEAKILDSDIKPDHFK